MKMFLAALAVVLLGAGDPTTTTRQSTDRWVHGVITSVDGGAITITTAEHAVSGRFDATRTKVTVNGHPAHLSDLKVTAHAKAELCLDDTWVSIDSH